MGDKFISALTTFIPFIGAYPSWVKILFSVWILLTAAVLLSFIFARHPFTKVETVHKKSWTFESGVDQDQSIFLNEVAQNAIKYTVKGIEANLKYRYSVKDKSKARRAEIYIKYHIPDHGWPASHSQSIKPTNSQWKSLAFTVTHSEIKDAWLAFTLLDEGQTLEARRLSTRLTITKQ